MLADGVGEKLRTKGLTLALAESCTGGKLGDIITEVPPGSNDRRKKTPTAAKATLKKALGVLALIHPLNRYNHCKTLSFFSNSR